MASRKIEDLHPTLAYAFGRAQASFMAVHPEAPVPFLTCTYRSKQEQDKLFAAIPKVTNARGGQSPHNFLPSCAFDVAFRLPSGAATYEQKWFDLFAPFVQASGDITWGGTFRSFKDKPHFELTVWRVLVQKV